MVMSCSVEGCTNRYNNKEKRQFFKFPLQNPDLLNKWIEVIGRHDFIPSKYSKVCSDHFKETDYLPRPGTYRPQLKPTAVPSIFTYTTRLTRFKENKRTFDLKLGSKLDQDMRNCNDISVDTLSDDLIDPLGSCELDQVMKNCNEIPVTFKVESFSDDLIDPLGSSELDQDMKRCNDISVSLKVESFSDDLIDPLGSSEFDQDMTRCNDILVPKVESLSEDDVKSEDESEHKFELNFSNIPDKDFTNTKDPLSLSELDEYNENILPSDVYYDHNSKGKLSEPPQLESHSFNNLEASLKLTSDVPNDVQDIIGDSDISDEDSVESSNSKDAFNSIVPAQIRSILFDHNYAMTNKLKKLATNKDCYLSELRKKLKCLQQKVRRRDRIINKLRLEVLELTKKQDLKNSGQKIIFKKLRLDVSQLAKIQDLQSSENTIN